MSIRKDRTTKAYFVGRPSDKEDDRITALRRAATRKTRSASNARNVKKQKKIANVAHEALTRIGQLCEKEQDANRALQEIKSVTIDALKRCQQVIDECNEEREKYNAENIQRIEEEIERLRSQVQK